MRTGLVIALVVAAVITAEASKRRGYVHLAKHRPRPREIRGFKPESISTAIGFGKREGSPEASKLNRRDSVLATLLRNFPRGVASEWLFREMKTDPLYAGELIRMLIDDENGQRSMTDFKPDRTISIF